MGREVRGLLLLSMLAAVVIGGVYAHRLAGDDGLVLWCALVAVVLGAVAVASPRE